MKTEPSQKRNGHAHCSPDSTGIYVRLFHWTTWMKTVANMTSPCVSSGSRSYLAVSKTS